VENEAYWKSYWAYISDTTDEAAPEGEEAMVTAFTARTTTLSLAPALTAAVGAGDTYELRRFWSATAIHAAIDHALEEAAVQFPNDSEDETVVIQEDVLDYTIPSTIDYVYSVSLLNHEVLYRSTATAGAALSLTDSTQAWTVNALAGMEVAVYSGTGAGQYRTISSNTATALTVSVAWVTNPDSTSKYLVKDLTDEVPIVTRLTNYIDIGGKLHFRQLLDEGQRLRIAYRPLHVTLATDAATTTLPKTYVVYRAAQELLLMSPAVMPDANVKQALALHDRLEPLVLRYITMNKRNPRASTWLNRGRQSQRARWDRGGFQEIGTRKND
jgi:hypothetical protein